MKIIECEQGTPEWYQARLGIPTASEFFKILSPTGKVSSQADAYANTLLAEEMAGQPLEAFEGTSWMQRGKEIEQEAVMAYELITGEETTKVGFCTDDGRTMGCSPDRLVGDDGLLEIKCPKHNTHIGYLLGDELDNDYTPQIQGQLLVTGRQWVDWMAFHPLLKPIIIRVQRNEAYISSLSKQLDKFRSDLMTKRTRLIDLGHLK